MGSEQVFLEGINIWLWYFGGYDLPINQLTDSPSCSFPDGNCPKEKRRKWILDICTEYVKKYILTNQEGIQPLVEQVQELDVAGASRFPCRVPNCEKTYAFHSGRKKYVV